MTFDFMHVFSAFMVLFAVIDIVGSIPVIVDIKEKGNEIESGKSTLVAFGILLLFLFVGKGLLGVFGVDISSFAIAGSFVLFFLSMEMILGIELFKSDTPKGASIVPIAFPLIAGAGSITSLLSLKAEYNDWEILAGLALNMILVFVVLKLTKRIGKMLGKTGVMILRKVFGIILLSIAIKLFMSNVVSSINSFFPGIVDKLNHV